MGLFVDSREPRHLIDELMLQVPTVQVHTMAYGDFLIEGANQRVVIERKEINDLFASLNDGRFYEQMKGLEKLYPDYKRILLIEGDIFQAMKYNKGITMARFTGTKASIVYGWPGLTLMHTVDRDETVDFLKRLTEKIGDGGEEQYPRSLGFTKNARTANEELVDILRGIDGIGEQKATDLLQKFRTVSHTARASAEELTRVLGEKDGLHVFKAFRRRWADKKDKKEES